MQQRQSRQGQSVVAGNSDFLIEPVAQAAPQQMGIDLEIRPAKALLDDYFPKTGGTEQ
jgi:hypothetical protein